MKQVHKQTFAPVWAEIVARHARRAALRFGDRAWTYEELDRQVAALSADLQSLKARTVLFAPTNDPASLAFILASLCSEAVPILADPVWTPLERDRIMQRDGIMLEVTGSPRSLVAEMDRRVLRLEDFAIRDGSEQVSTRRLQPTTVLGRFTSGSTSSPRCLQFALAAVLAAANGWRLATDLDSADRVLCLATLNNGLAFNTSLLSLFLAGGELALLPGPTLAASAIARACERVEPTVLVAFPFVFELLMRAGRPLSTPPLRLAVSSAAKLDDSVSAYWRDRGLPICNYYGLAEVGPVTCNLGGVRDSQGTPLSHADLRVTGDDGKPVPASHEGIVRVRTTSMATDYLDDEEPSFASTLDPNGYFVTKDVAFLDEAGHLHLRGRLDRLLNISGRKIEPREVEQAIGRMPGVTDVVVTGEQSEGKTAVVAYVESSALSSDAVRTHCIEHLAPYKVPHCIYIVDRLPRSSAGKLAVGRLSATEK
jgi:acyl-coenzyme A synthetase/AMP-(fatty) acid ligase